MSGGVDSSVAAALLLEQGHEVVGATMKLWGGASDSGCCSVADVEDARRVAQQLGIVHHVFNFTADFEARVVAPYVEGHRDGLTPNPCVECNRHLKFDRFLVRAGQLGFAAVATGHHARVRRAGGRWRLRRAVDGAKDQSYVLSMLGQDQLRRCLFPVGEMAKSEVRARAAALGLPTAAKPDSQDVCFITSQAGRSTFLGDRIPLHPGRLVDAVTGAELGAVDAVELVTVGQRRGLGLGPPVGGVAAGRQYALDVDVAGRRVAIGPLGALLSQRVDVAAWTWVDRPVAAGTEVLAQFSAHGRPAAGGVRTGPPGVELREPQRRVAPGQTVALYSGDEVVGSGVAVPIRPF